MDNNLGSILLVIVISFSVLEERATVPTIAMQTPEEFELILKFNDPKYSFEDLAKYAQVLRDKAADKKTKTILDSYLAKLRVMAATANTREKEKDEVKKLILDLRHQRCFDTFSTDDPNSAAAKLLSMGKKAIPYLIDELENDEFTRSVSFGITINKELPRVHVQRVGDWSRGILWEITGKRFGDSWNIHDPRAGISPQEVKRLYKAWWEKEAK